MQLFLLAWEHYVWKWLHLVWTKGCFLWTWECFLCKWESILHEWLRFCANARVFCVNVSDFASVSTLCVKATSSCARTFWMNVSTCCVNARTLRVNARWHGWMSDFCEGENVACMRVPSFTGGQRKLNLIQEQADQQAGQNTCRTTVITLTLTPWRQRLLKKKKSWKYEREKNTFKLKYLYTSKWVGRATISFLIHPPPSPTGQSDR